MRGRDWIFLGILAAVLFAARAHTFREPLERDIATYAVIGHELRLGRALYTDLWDNKPPAIYATYALGESLAGYGPAAIFLINMIAALAGLGGCYAAGSALGGRRGGAGAALCWVLLSGDLFLQANQPNTELFINVCLLWFLALRFGPPLIKPEGLRALAAGLLAGLATFYKYTALVPILTVGIMDLTLKDGPGAGARRPNARPWLIILGTVIVLWGALCVYFISQHRLQTFIDLVFRFNWHYAGSGGGMLGGISPVARIVSVFSILLRDPRLVVVAVPLTLISLVGAIAGFRGTQRRLWILGSAFAAGTVIEIAVPGHFYAHYFQRLLPVWVLGAGWTFAQPQRPLLKKIAFIGGAIGSLFLLARQLPQYRWAPAEWSRMKYEDRFVDAPALSAEISRLLAPGEVFYNWGSDPELYFYARMRPPTGMFLQYPLVREPFLDRSNARVIRDLEQAPPELVVVSKYRIEPERPRIPIVEWVRDHYAEFPGGGDRGAFILLARKNGALLHRFKTPGVKSYNAHG